MKLILTGATGYVGAEVLRQCLSNTKVTSVVTLTRRPLSESNHTKNIDTANPKLNAMILKDFTTDYPPEVIEQIKGADGVVWNLGTLPTKHTPEETKRTAIEMPKVAVKAFSAVSRDGGQGPLKVVFVSGEGVERNQDAQGLLWKGEFRKLKVLYKPIV